MATDVMMNPYQDRLDAQRRLLADPLRQSDAQRLQLMGLLGMLSGDEGLSNAGQNMLSLASKQQEREAAQNARLEDQSASYSGAVAEARQKAQERAEAAAQQRQWQEQQAKAQQDFHASQAELARAAMAGNQAPIAVMGPNGQAVYVGRSQALGQQPAPSGGTQASEDERKAAGWLQQAGFAYNEMKEALRADPRAASPTTREIVTGAIPGLGQGAAYAGMTPSRQRFTTAASQFSEAVLRAATGAGVNKEEAMQKVQELTPRFGEAAAVTDMKERSAQMYLQTLQTRAGRAAPGGGSNFPRARAAGGAANAPAGSAAQPPAQAPNHYRVDY